MEQKFICHFDRCVLQSVLVFLQRLHGSRNALAHATAGFVDVKDHRFERVRLSVKRFAIVTPAYCTPRRQQTPKCCDNRNHGLCASISSCLRLAAEMSLALRGLMSGASNISSSC